ncbi:MAG: hypothetical protein P1U83_09675 [Roseovarius sp.]|nr:hypothetical protein [Roseovarius sp.]
MKQILLIALIGLAACTPASISTQLGVTVGGVKYDVRSVDGDFLAVHEGTIISDEHKEVKVDGKWYDCHISCAATVQAVLTSKAALAAERESTQAAAVTEEEADRSGGSGGGGGY